MPKIRTWKRIKLLLTILAIIGIIAVILGFSIPLAYAAPDDKPTPTEGNWTPDEWILAQLIHREAGNQDCYGQLAVCEVVLNRVYCKEVAKEYRRNIKRYPDTIRGVILQRGQFTPTENKRWFLSTKPTERELLHARMAISDFEAERAGLPRMAPRVLDKPVMFFRGNGEVNRFFYYVRHRGRWTRVYVGYRGTDHCEYCKAFEELERRTEYANAI